MLMQCFFALVFLSSAWLFVQARSSAGRRAGSAVAAGLLFVAGVLGLGAVTTMATAVAMGVLYLLVGVPLASVLTACSSRQERTVAGPRQGVAIEAPGCA